MKAFLLHQKAVLYTMAVLIILAIVVIFATRPARSAFWIGGAVFGFGLLASIASFILSKLRSERIFDGRNALTEEQIYRHFADAGLPSSVVLELWREVASTLNVPSEKLRPTDRFGHELGGYWITSEDLDALGQIAAARASRGGISLDLSNIGTLDQYVRTFAITSVAR